ncbi:MAG: hypothetical protein ABI237_11260 [Ginsengibacter sp.]
MQIRKRPYNLLLLTGLILILTCFFFFNQNTTIDIHLHDTYFVIAHSHFFWLLAIPALMIWTIYLLTNKILYSKALTWVHVIITISTLVLLASTLFMGESLFNPAPKHYYDYSSWNSSVTTPARIIADTIFILLSGQIIFIINFIAGIFKRKT